MSFLFKGLRDKHKYWEAVNLFRKGMHALSATVLAPLGADVQILFMFMVLVVYLGLGALARPYEKQVRRNKAGLPLPHINSDHEVVLETTDSVQRSATGDDGATQDPNEGGGGIKGSSSGDFRRRRSSVGHGPPRPSASSSSSGGGRRGSMAPGAVPPTAGTQTHVTTKPSEMSDDVYMDWSIFLWEQLCDSVRETFPPAPELEIAPSSASRQEKIDMEQRN